jgi:Flp pilus assembly protein TadG
MRREDGQSTVEVIGLLPLLLAVGLGVLAFLNAGAAREAAGGAAEAGAVAILQGRDARAAARSALPGWPHDRTTIHITGRRVTVAVTPKGPLGARLRATATADAGPPSAASDRSRRTPSSAVSDRSRRTPSSAVSDRSRRTPSAAASDRARRALSRAASGARR